MWRAIVEPGFVETKVEQIARELKDRSRDLLGRPGLLDGAAGLALFFLYHSRFTRQSQDRQYAEQFLGELLESLPDEMSFSFCSGLAGISWLIRHAAREHLIEGDPDPLLQDFDEQVRWRMVIEMEAGRFDFLHGALGCALYFFDAPANERSHEALVRTLDALERYAERDGPLIWWRNELVLMDGVPKDAISLGLSHGVPSVLDVLLRYVEARIETERARRLAEGAAAFILASELEKDPPSFPSMVSREAPSAASRLAWCYGDPGVASALWRAGQVLDRPDLREKSLSVFARAAGCRSDEDARVVDACCCHGSAGLALMFARMFNRTGRDDFQSAARHWLDRTIALGGSDTEFAGYRAQFPGMEPTAADHLCVITGIAGIGLTLMALASPIEPAWDRALLLS